jgi:hypothetical protein
LTCLRPTVVGQFCVRHAGTGDSSLQTSDFAGRSACSLIRCVSPIRLDMAEHQTPLVMTVAYSRGPRSIMIIILFQTFMWRSSSPTKGVTER